MQVALALVVVGLTIWILGPSVGFLWKGPQLEVDVHPEAMLAKPYPEDADGLRRYHEFIELGMEPLGSTWEHARFFTPIHWRWRSLQGLRWLVSPDARTFVHLNRLVEDEPVRFGAVTVFEGGGTWHTSYPGVAGELPRVEGHGHLSVRCVGPAGLLEKHAEHVEAFGREHGLTVKAATLQELAAASLAYERAVLPKMGLAGLMALPLGTFGLSFAMSAPMLARGGTSRVVGLGTIIFMGLFYAVLRHGALHLMRSHTARRMHTRAFDLEQTAVTPDGTIVAGRYERWVRAIAVLGAGDAAVKLAILASKSPAIVRMRTGPIFMCALLAILSALTLRELVARTRGRTVRMYGKQKRKTDVWFGWAFLGFLYSATSRHANTTPYLIWLGAVVALAFVAWQLEKHGRA